MTIADDDGEWLTFTHGPQANADNDWLAAISPAIVPPPSDWTGSDADGYTNAKLKARVMCLGAGAEWWAQMNGRWVNDPKDGGPLAFPTARMAREQVEHRRAKEQAG